MNRDRASMDIDQVKVPPQPGQTHAEWGSGNPRLRVSGEGERHEHPLNALVTTIGSAEDCTIQLPRIAAYHARIQHDERDEYVLTLLAPGEMNANPQSAGTHGGEHTETLRTGARFTAGPWTFVFAREEFADHGRPYGGREGGEFSDQTPQPERPDYAADSVRAAASGLPAEQAPPGDRNA